MIGRIRDPLAVDDEFVEMFAAGQIEADRPEIALAGHFQVVFIPFIETAGQDHLSGVGVAR